MSDGAYFGELALVTHKPRAASIYAVGVCKVAGEIHKHITYISIIHITYIDIIDLIV